MVEHPCPMPKRSWWRRGRNWTCECGKEYWLLENARQIMYDWEVDWQWVRLNRNALGFNK